MALSLQAANLVRQKTYMIALSPGIFYGLKALFLHLASNKGNPDLQIAPVDGTSSSSDGGAVVSTVSANVAHTLYAIYLKKVGSTAVSFKISDNATTATGDGTQSGPNLVFTTAKDDILLIYPQGHAMVNGLTWTQQTTQTGTTQTLKANRVDGFIIIGA